MALKETGPRKYAEGDPRRGWTSEEVSLLRELSPSLTDCDIGERLGRSRSSVLHAKMRFGIRGRGRHDLPPDHPRELERRRKISEVRTQYASDAERRHAKYVRQRDELARLRGEIHEALGDECSVVGCEAAYLEVDHVFEDGQEHRRLTNRGLPYYRSILADIQSGNVSRYQLLCKRHHTEKTWH